MQTSFSILIQLALVTLFSLQIQECVPPQGELFFHQLCPFNAYEIGALKQLGIADPFFTSCTLLMVLWYLLLHPILEKINYYFLFFSYIFLKSFGQFFHKLNENTFLNIVINCNGYIQFRPTKLTLPCLTIIKNRVRDT